MVDILNLINTSLTHASSWFVSVFVGSGMADVYLTFIFVIMAVRFLVVPVFGSSRGSDRARSHKEE